MAQGISPRRQTPPRERQHPQSLCRHLIDGAVDRVGIAGHTLPGSVEHRITARQDSFHRSFHIDDTLLVGTGVVQRRHVLVLRLEGNGVEAWREPILAVNARFVRHSNQRPFGRVAAHVPALFLFNQFAVVAQETGAQTFRKRTMRCQINRIAVAPNLTIGLIPGPGRFISLAARHNALHRHLVLRQRAGFVGTDDRRASQGLDGWQFANDRPAPRHTGDANRQGHRDRRR